MKLVAKHPPPCARWPAGPSGPDWLAIAFGFWYGRALATGTAWAGLYFIHHHDEISRKPCHVRTDMAVGPGKTTPPVEV